MRLSRPMVGLAVAACLMVIPAPTHAEGTPPHGTPPTATPSKPTGSSTPTTTPAAIPPPKLNPIAAKISVHPQLDARVKTLLPSGTSLNDASKGFKNQGQFIAALHVSQNLGIPFKSLKQDMTTKNLSLGQSIHDLKKTASSTREAERAEHQADHDLKNGGSTSVATRIGSNPALTAKVQALLPAGTTLKQASLGFRSQEQFLAALHASKNLSIPFAQLHAEMTGKDHDSLGVAIGELKPGSNATQQAQLAETQARQDLQTTKPPTTGDID